MSLGTHSGDFPETTGHVRKKAKRLRRILTVDTARSGRSRHPAHDPDATDDYKAD